MKWSDKLVILYLTSLSIFRIDFFSQKASFYFTPTLLLSILMILALPLLFMSGNVRVSKNLGYFGFVILSFLGWCLLTIFPIHDSLQLKRYVLFAIIILSTCSFLIILSRKNNVSLLFEKFVHLFLVVYLFYCVVDILTYIFPTFEAYLINNFPFFITHLSHIGYHLIRLKGGFFDSNISGYFLIFLFLILKYLDTGKSKRKLITVLIFCTFSRSSIAVYILIRFVLWIKKVLVKKQAFNIPTAIKSKKVQITAASILLVSIVFYFLFTNTSFGTRLSDALATRLSSKEESASIHLALLNQGVDFILSYPYYLFKGYGFGSSFLLTQNFFPGDKYANFHSEYITLLIETGLPGFILYLSIFILPVIVFLNSKNLNKDFYLLIAMLAFCLENILYQQYLFHYYWVFLGLIWILPQQKGISDQKKYTDN